MEINYYNEELCVADVENMTADEIECAIANLQAAIDDNNEQNDILGDNIDLLEGRLE